MMVSFLVRVATLSVVVLAMAGPAVSAADSPLNHLDGADLIDLLDAELDEDFLTNGFRNLQQFEMTGSPTPSPTAGFRGLGTVSPTADEIPTGSPTAVPGATTSPTMVVDTPGPTVVAATFAPITSGAVSWRPASVAASLAAVVATAAAVLA